MRSWIILLSLIAGIGGVVYWQRSIQTVNPPLVAVTPPSPTPQKQANPSPHYPVRQVHEETRPLDQSTTATQKPVPTLNESDPSIQEELFSIFGKAQVLKLINLKDIIRRIVVTVENATGKRIPPEYLPVIPPQGKFIVSGKVDQFIDPANYSRYSPYVAFAEAMDVRKLVATYVRFYSVFQNAYSELGNRNYFNDRVVEAIDQMLATPEVKGPISVIPSTVAFKYADTELEALSASQKLLIRMGPENEEHLKTVLRLLRGKLSHLDENN